MSTVPVFRGGLLVRSVALVGGLFVFSAGIVMVLQSELGLGSWDVLNQGIAERTPLSFGMANVVVAVAVLLVAVGLGARIGQGTIVNAIAVGFFVDLLTHASVIPTPARVPGQAALLGGGVVAVGVASGVYISAGLGAGPRDSLMLVLAARTKRSIRAVRTVVEVSVTAIGFVLGGDVGVGTIAFALTIGPVVGATFTLLADGPLTNGADPRGHLDEPPVVST